MSALARPYMTSGADAVKATVAMRERQARLDQWPYWWSYPAPNSTGKRVMDSVAVPVAGTPTVIVEYQVPNACKFVLESVAIDYSGGTSGGGWVQGRGDSLFSITCNQPLTLTAPQGFAVDGFNEIPFLVGSLQGPFNLGKPEIFKAQDIVRIVGTNVNLADGDPNYWLGALIGWIMPE